VKKARHFVIPHETASRKIRRANEGRATIADDHRLIKAALGAYMEGAKSLASTLRLESFHGRLAVFQNLAVRTERKNDNDDFFGWMNPDPFDEAGNTRPGP
jgi:hypothetical protein